MAAHQERSTDFQSVDIFSPLANLEWSENSCDWPGGILPSQVVLLRDKVYVGVTSRQIRRPTGSRGELHCCSTTDLSSWTSLAVPGVKKFGLGTYRSQLVLVGGVNCTHKVVGDVWASEDGTKWQQSESLPPLPTPCQQPAVINIGSPEYLIVAGGYRNTVQFRALDTISVLGEGQWFLVEHFPVPSGSIKYTIYNGNLYLSGNIRSTCYCKVESLIAACDLVKSGTVASHKISWRTFNTERLTVLPVSFGRQLVGVKMYRLMRTRAEIYAYHPFTRSWVHVGELPIAERPVCAFVLHTAGELVVLCRTITRPIRRRKFTVLKATLQVSPYDPDSHFNMGALSKLEAAEIKVVTLLSGCYQQLVAATGVMNAPADNLKLLIHYWLSGQSARPATWRSLHEVLRELGLEELSQQIEDDLTCTGTESLKERSTSVIMSALLQQKSLELSHLYARLPCYVPPTVKRYIIHQYVAITHQTHCPVSPGLELESPIVLPFPTPQATEQIQPRPHLPAPVLRPSLQRLLRSVGRQAVPPIPSRSVVLQAVQPHRVDPQAVSPQPVDPQAVPPRPVGPQAVPLRPVDPQAVPPQPVNPQAVPPQPVDRQAVSRCPVGPQAVTPLPVDRQAVPPPSVDPPSYTTTHTTPPATSS